MQRIERRRFSMALLPARASSLSFLLNHAA